MNDNDQPKTHNPPLPVLLRSYNKLLNWRPSDMATWMGKDNAEISRWLSLKKPHRLQDTTLEFIARRYQEAGIENATVEVLKHARDFGGRADQHNPFNLPDHWSRLMTQVLSFDDDFQYKMFMKWSQDLEFSAQLLHRGQRANLKLTDLSADQSSESTPRYTWPTDGD
jgi:hypothetical protein